MKNGSKRCALTFRYSRKDEPSEPSDEISDAGRDEKNGKGASPVGKPTTPLECFNYSVSLAIEDKHSVELFSVSMERPQPLATSDDEGEDEDGDCDVEGGCSGKRCCDRDHGEHHQKKAKLEDPETMDSDMDSESDGMGNVSIEVNHDSIYQFMYVCLFVCFCLFFTLRLNEPRAGTKLTLTYPILSVVSSCS
jgi:hypothetical protein